MDNIAISWLAKFFTYSSIQAKLIATVIGVIEVKTSFSVALISTDGTIEKTYNEHEGNLSNGIPVLEMMLGSLQLDGVSIHHSVLMNKDSNDMSDEDHELIAQEVKVKSSTHDRVIVIHGTDTLSLKGDIIVQRNPNLTVPCCIDGCYETMDYEEH